MKSPKVYVRDSGLLHALLGIPDETSLADLARIRRAVTGERRLRAGRDLD